MPRSRAVRRSVFWAEGSPDLKGLAVALSSRLTIASVRQEVNVNEPRWRSRGVAQQQ
jgi:hypothetical protein